MAWINYKKAYNKVSYYWIKECLDLFGVAENIISLLVIVWKRQELAEVDIKQYTLLEHYFISFSTCFSTDPVKLNFKKGQGSI